MKSNKIFDGTIFLAIFLAKAQTEWLIDIYFLPQLQTELACSQPNEGHVQKKR